MRARIKGATRVIGGGSHLSVVALTPKPNDDAVHMFNAAMEKAMSGAVDGAAVITVNHDGSVGTGFVVGRNVFNLVGAIELLGTRVKRAFE